MKKNKKGFTLVELIVVLVILAILAAVLIPTLLGYIDKARNQQAILECRYCVQGAQGLAAEKYAVGESLEYTEDNAKKVLELSDLNGEIETWEIKDYKVSLLVYKAENGVFVSYVDYEYKIGNFGNNLGVVEKRTEILNTFADTIKQEKLSGTLDSGASEDPSSGTNKILTALHAAGLDLSTYKANSWQYLSSSNDGPFFYWTPEDIQSKSAGDKVYVMRYNATSGTYTVWQSIIKKNTLNGKTYNIFSGYQGYAPSTSQNKEAQTYDNMLALYNKAVGN